MAKRLIDTELWNNEDIIEYFTAEDKYFWLYLLTNPHNNICGVMKASPVLIARDMGYSKESIQNLLYRFENVHKAIYVDNETHELVILNWAKFNWNKSPDIMKTVEKNLPSINSQTIRDFLLSKINEIWNGTPCQHPVDTLSTPSQQGTITITNTNTNTIYNNEFEEVWKLYPNKKGKDKSLKLYIKARKDGASFEEIKQGVINYATECDVKKREKQYIQHGSTWFGNKRWEDEYELSGATEVKSASDEIRDKQVEELLKLFGGE